MTVQKAILCLRGMKWSLQQGNPIWSDDSIIMVIDMAIEALKKEQEKLANEK